MDFCSSECEKMELEVRVGPFKLLKNHLLTNQQQLGHVVAHLKTVGAHNDVVANAYDLQIVFHEPVAHLVNALNKDPVGTLSQSLGEAIVWV